MAFNINGDNNVNLGGVAYGVSGSTLAFSVAGTVGQYLISNGTSPPTWANAATIAGSTGQLQYNNAGAFGAISSGTSGQVLSSGGSGAAPTWVSAGAATANIGYLNIPQNSQSAAYTLVLADSGKSIYHPSADTTARIWTIPANSSVAYPIGTAITFINDTSAGVITIAITSDTLVLAGAGTTGSRTLAANGMATAIKMTSTRWMISGSGLT